MKKKLACILLAVVIALSLATAAFAAVSTDSPILGPRGGWNCPNGFGRGFMRSDDGSLLTAEAFAQRVDEAIQSGLIAESDRQRLIDLHQWCLENGGLGCGNRGQGRGRGAATRNFGCRWR